MKDVESVELESLMVHLRTWCSDEEQAKAVIVLSASKNALEVKFNLGELRATYLCIDDLTTR